MVPLGDEQGPVLLARGPWREEEIVVHWHQAAFRPTADQQQEADRAIARLRNRGSPSQDGLAGRLKGFAVREGRLELELQPLRWSLRLVQGDAARSLSVLCVARDAAGRYLAGRRAGWVASWAGRWTLGAGGAVDPFEHPCVALLRELKEEWSLEPARLTGEALIELPHRLVMFVGQAWLAPGAERALRMDQEHEAHAWWPAEIERWPDHASEPLRQVAKLING